MSLTPEQEIYHLLRRTGFGPSPAEFTKYLAMGYEAAVAALLDDEKITETLDPTGGIANFDATKLDHLRLLWMYKMLNSQKQLHEKMVFFWHDHFACQSSSVENAAWMWRQNELFRANAFADFKTLLLSVAKDPAMMTQLDTIRNSKGSPNENYAREIMELHSLGVGNYTETDIKEAARCFTGWRFNSTTGDFSISTGSHDNGSKTIFPTLPAPVAKTGNLNGDDVVDSVVRHPACPPFLVGKLYRFFVGETVDGDSLNAALAIYTSSGFSVREVLRSLLLSKAFRSEASYRSRVKSPLEFLIGAIKHLGIGTVPLRAPAMLREQAMDLFEPPSVKGWPDSRDWVGTTSLMIRANQINELVSTKGTDGKYYFDAIAYTTATGMTTLADLLKEVLGRMIDNDVPQTFIDKLGAYYLSSTSNAKQVEMPAVAAQDVAPAATTRRIFIPAAMNNFAGSLQAQQTWTGQTRKLRGLYYLTMSSPAYQLN